MVSVLVDFIGRLQNFLLYACCSFITKLKIFPDKLSSLQVLLVSLDGFSQKGCRCLTGWPFYLNSFSDKISSLKIKNCSSFSYQQICIARNTERIDGFFVATWKNLSVLAFSTQGLKKWVALVGFLFTRFSFASLQSSSYKLNDFSTFCSNFFTGMLFLPQSENITYADCGTE